MDEDGEIGGDVVEAGHSSADFVESPEENPVSVFGQVLKDFGDGFFMNVWLVGDEKYPRFLVGGW